MSKSQRLQGDNQQFFDPHRSNETRLQKFLAEAGFGSRRACEALILEGRVQIDDRLIESLGTKVNPNEQVVYVDGQRVKPERKKYFVINKPSGVISTASDPAGRTRVVDLIPSAQRIYNVGRLDQFSEGLLIVTNDGELANRLTHPKFGIHKTYLVKVTGTPDGKQLSLLRRGVHLAEGFAKVEQIRVKKTLKNASELEMVLTEGRNREIRRLLARIGHKVLQLKRIGIGSFRLGDLPVGACRELTRADIEKLTTKPRPKQPTSTPTPNAEPASVAEAEPTSRGSKRGAYHAPSSSKFGQPRNFGAKATRPTTGRKPNGASRGKQSSTTSAASSERRGRGVKAEGDRTPSSRKSSRPGSFGPKPARPTTGRKSSGGPRGKSRTRSAISPTGSADGNSRGRTFTKNKPKRSFKSKSPGSGTRSGRVKSKSRQK